MKISTECENFKLSKLKFYTVEILGSKMKIPVMTGDELRSLRKKRLGLTQTQIGRVLGVSTGQVCILEQREILPPLYALAVMQLEKIHRDAA